MRISLAGKSKKAAPRDPRSRSASGVTLVELLVVVAILGFTTTLILPSIGRGFGHWRLLGAAREVATMVKVARTQSVTMMRPLQLILDRSRNLYWLDRADAPLLLDRDQADKRHVRFYALPDDVRFGEIVTSRSDGEDGRFRFLFLPRGTSSGGEIELWDRAGRGYRISIDSVTGRAAVARSGG